MGSDTEDDHLAQQNPKSSSKSKSKTTAELTKELESLRHQMSELMKVVKSSIDAKIEDNRNTNNLVTVDNDEQVKAIVAHKPNKLKIKLYSGHDEYITANNWIRFYSTLAENQGWSDEQKVKNLFSYLEAEAITWYFESVKGETDEWKDIEKTFIERFGASDNVTYSKLQALT